MATIGADNRITSDGTYSYLYDDEGNLLRRTSIATGDVVEYQWDLGNELTDARFFTMSSGVLSLSKAVHYPYNTSEQRMAKSVDGTEWMDPAAGAEMDASITRDGIAASAPLRRSWHRAQIPFWLSHIATGREKARWNART